ncbi:MULTISPECIES: FAD-binding oxidoreductase [unclassified Microbacterium]|uniref:NAD(P)/FAD-dependent oxidoreductase n=1 Tax=unclassified Microbacterium TaxID=2609290 RepID=UPI00214AFC8A|nr:MULTISPECIES: FAD-binding oxidoreductase [unclassified Microbacterium]MCR2785647.1 FAD-binding oxidoreductase [Microbacterium sp. zg.B96]WIM17368.1 FAD-binding oxidoreductase [Microbacterium sp. zg-B96]
MSSTIIIGAGAVGSALAYYLSKEGEDVTVIDGGGVAEGTTSASFSMHIATRKTPRQHFDLAMESGQEHLRLLEALDIPLDSSESWVHPASVYEWPIDEYESELISSRVERVQEWGHPARWISTEEFGELEPQLRVDGDADRVAMYPDSYWYDAPLFARTLTQRAAATGARFETGRRVVGIERGDDGVDVIVEGGDRYRADRVCIAAGAAAAEIAQLAGFTVPVNRVPGLVLTSEPVEPGLMNGILLHPRVNLRPAPGGRLTLQSYSEEAHVREDSDAAHIAQLTDRIATLTEQILPAFAGTGIADAAIGIRPVPADGLPIVGPLDERGQVVIVSAHSAINLAPVLAKRATGELITGTGDDTLAPFRPGRSTLTDPSSGEVDESSREMQRMYVESRSAALPQA